LLKTIKTYLDKILVNGFDLKLFFAAGALFVVGMLLQLQNEIVGSDAWFTDMLVAVLCLALAGIMFLIMIIKMCKEPKEKK
jgi:hypothetical protein